MSLTLLDQLTITYEEFSVVEISTAKQAPQNATAPSSHTGPTANRRLSAQTTREAANTPVCLLQKTECP